VDLQARGAPGEVFYAAGEFVEVGGEEVSGWEGGEV